MKIILKDFPYVISEDGMRSQTAEIAPDESECLFVHIKSWDESKVHSDFNRLVKAGKRITVTLEVED